MDYQQIEKILEKYWEGKTTLEEEITLKDFFTQEEVPEHLKDCAALFKYFSEEEKNAPLGLQFEEKVLNKIHPNRSGKLLSWQFIMKIAATVLIMVAVGTVFFQNSKIKSEPLVYVDTYEDPEVAYEEMKKALTIFSSQLNKGTEKLTEISEFNKPEEILNNP